MSADAQPPLAVEHQVARFFVGRVGRQLSFVVTGRAVIANNVSVARYVQPSFTVKLAQERVVLEAQLGQRPEQVEMMLRHVGDEAREFLGFFNSRLLMPRAADKVAVGVAAQQADVVLAKIVGKLPYALKALAGAWANRGQIAQYPE